MNRSLLCTPILAMLLTLVARAPAQPATSPTTAPIISAIAQDPQLQALRNLDWRPVDLAAIDAKTRCEALLALNAFFTRVDEQARDYADFLVAYLQAKGLKEAYDRDDTPLSETPDITYENAKRLAVAFVRSPAGKDRFDSALADASPAVIDRYITLYEKTCQRNWSDLMLCRFQIRSMVTFLQNQGKLQDYQNWAVEESARREKAKATDTAARREKALANEEERRRAALAEADKRKAQEQELALKRMDYAFQYQKAQLEAQRDVDVAYYRRQNVSYDDWGSYYNHP